MSEGIIVDVLPVAFDEGGDQQEQGAFGLVEVGDDVPDDLALFARCDDDLGGGDLRIRLMFIQIIEDLLQRLGCRQPVVVLFVRHPLFDDHIR